MANLPDLNTDNVGLVAYWNALQHGASYLDPAPAVKYNPVDSFEAYDNGITGTLTHSFARKSRQFHFRMKTDGWIVCWMDRTNNATDGYIDLVSDWTDQTTPTDLSSTTLGHHIEGLLNASSHDLPSGNFSHSDVQLYSPEHRKTVQASLFSWHESHSASTSATVSGSIRLTRDPIMHIAGGSVENSADGSGWVETNGVRYADVNNKVAVEYFDLPLRESVTVETNAPSSDGSYTTHTKQEHLLLF